MVKKNNKTREKCAEAVVNMVYRKHCRHCIVILLIISDYAISLLSFSLKVLFMFCILGTVLFNELFFVQLTFEQHPT